MKLLNLSGLLLAGALLHVSAAIAQPGVITTVAGNGSGVFGGDGGPATSSSVSAPAGTAFDKSGNMLIADFGNNRIRKVNLTTGVITTIAGSGTTYGYSGDGGPATAAKLHSPGYIVLDAVGNIYFSDTYNNRIRRIDAVTGVITTIAGTGYGAPTTGDFAGDGGPASAAHFYFPTGLAMDAAGDLFIADWSNSRIRKITMTTGIINTIAGTGAWGYSGDGGPAISATFRQPWDIAFDNAGNLYTCEYSNSTVRKINMSTGIITTVAGTGVAGYSGDGGAATNAQLYKPMGITLDGAGNIYISDWKDNNRIRKVDAATGIITTIAGTGVAGYAGDGGQATAAQLNGTDGVKLDALGNLYISDEFNHVIRKVESVAAAHVAVPVVANSNKIDVYPNPVSNELMIDAAVKITSVSVTNALGQLVYSGKYAAEHVRIDVSAYAPGVYFARINETENRTFIKK